MENISYRLNKKTQQMLLRQSEEKKLLTDAANSKSASYLQTNKQTNKRTNKKGYLQTQQTPNPLAQDPEATPPLLLHSASVRMEILSMVLHILTTVS